MSFILPSGDVVADRLVKYTARKASGLPVDDIDLQRIVGSSRYIIMRKVIGIISSSIVIKRRGLIRCGICGKGTFTRRGFYLHLVRVHYNDILDLINRKYDELSKQYRDFNFY